MTNRWGNNGNSDTLFWGTPKSLQMVTAVMKVKDRWAPSHRLLLAPWKKSRQRIEKQRHYFAKKGPSSQSYGFSSSHVWM